MRVWVNRRGVDLLATGLVVWLYAIVGGGEWDPFVGSTQSERAAFFEAAAMLAGGALAVGVTVVAIVGSLTPRARIRYVVANAGLQLNRQLLACTASFAVSAAGYLALLLTMTTDTANGSWRFVAVGLAVLAGVRMARLMYLLNALLRAAAADAREVVDADRLPWEKPETDPTDYQVTRIPVSKRGPPRR